MAFACSYLQSATSSNVITSQEYGISYLSKLESRLQEVESNLKHLQTQFDKSQTATDHQIPASRSTFVPHNTVQLQDTDANSHEMDAMGAVVFDNETESGYFGPSSNIAFLQYISRAASAGGISDVFVSPRTDRETDAFQDQGLSDLSQKSSQLQASTAKKSEEVDLYFIPPEETALALLHRFFSYPGYFHPYIHEDNFLAIYWKIKDTPRPTVRRSWLALFNIILAMAVGTMVDSEINATERLKDAAIYYRRAVGIYSDQILRGASIESVHFMLLWGQYLQGTQKPVEAWTMHGLTIGAAHALGLHSTESMKRYPPLEQEIRKRTWFACMILDRSLCMTFGRPSRLPGFQVQHEMPHDHGFYPKPETSPAYEALNPINVEFYTNTIELYNFVGQIIDQLYGQNMGCGQPALNELYTRVFNVENELNDWESNLHPNLRTFDHRELTEMAGTSNMPRDRQISLMMRVVNTFRYMNTRLLLHRPILVKFLDLYSGREPREMGTMNMLQRLERHSIQVCQDTATDLISMVHTIATADDARRSLCGVWWYTLYYTFNAALVIFACFNACQQATSHRADWPVLTIGDAEQSIHKATEALGHLDRGNPTVERCQHYLRRLVGILQATGAASSHALTEMHSDVPDMSYFYGLENFGLEDPSLGIYFGDPLDLTSDL
ncbi:hypothetical protein H2200_005940 [Cladophialophora chaetospira]|uniref:Xylanolytic transcriptional activator regulatory domain-containing protein n=1 Tax=Cladophialophora chaetospira TaxID=386627 RepID=A0AA39CIW2_9EURO|nr:hypothetical protein H2200_005940 [Cladophialophora chaetospira]